MKILFALVAVITAIVSDGFDIKNDISSKLFEKYSVSCDSYSELHSGDAKFFGENIITSIGGIFTVISGEGDIRKYPDIHTNWVDCVADEGIVIYANFSKQVGMLRFDDEMNLVEHKILMENNHLYIDPAIVKVDHFYYMTFTEIIGNVNNANAADANGEYILHLYKTENFDSLFFVRELADDVHNIEDVELFYDGTELHAVYEYEMVDKSDSAIILQNFDKNGMNKGKKVELLQPDCDHEPAAMVPFAGGYQLYYSCDKEEHGASYMGANAYYAIYNRDFELVSKDHKINTKTDKGILFYDVIQKEEGTNILYARDYLADCDLNIETID